PTPASPSPSARRMACIRQHTARTRITDVADIKSPPLTFPDRDRPARRLEQHFAQRWTLLRRRNAPGEGVEVLKALLKLVKGAGEVEDPLATLPGHYAPGRERATIAHRLDVVDHRNVGPAGEQEIGVQRVQHPRH